jgi:hypothetical protein
MLDKFSKKNAEISNFIKMCPLRAELFHTDRWTDMKIKPTKHGNLGKLCKYGRDMENQWMDRRALPTLV